MRCIEPKATSAEAPAEPLPEDQLGREWEWEETPEVSLKIVDDLDSAIALFNRYSPQFTVSLINEDDAAPNVSTTRSTHHLSATGLPAGSMDSTR